MEMPEDGVWWLNYSQYEDLRLYEVGIQRCAPSYSFSLYIIKFITASFNWLFSSIGT